MLDWIVQHFIANVPIWMWAFAAGGGAGGYVISALAAKINALKPYAILLRIISIVVFSVSVFMAGGSGVAALWQQQIKSKQAEVDAAVAKSKTANTKIKYVVVQKIKVIHDKQIIVHNDIKRDAAAIDANCKVDPKAIKDLNEATE
jgi:hypothetical protein